MAGAEPLGNRSRASGAATRCITERAADHTSLEVPAIVAATGTEQHNESMAVLRSTCSNALDPDVRRKSGRAANVR